MLNPTPSTKENYSWTPEVSDNVAPGLDSMTTYTHSEYATLTALQDAITNINNNMHTEINNLEIPNQGNLNDNQEICYNTTHTDYTCQKVTPYTNMATAGPLSFRTISSHINEKVIKSYKFKH